MNQFFHSSDYTNILAQKIKFESGTIQIIDYLMGFDKNKQNLILDSLSDQHIKNRIETMYIIDKDENLYHDLDLHFSAALQDQHNFCHFKKYTEHPKVDIKNFLCSFNGSAHVSRKLLTACLDKMELFNPAYSSKNFTSSIDKMDGYLNDYLSDNTDRFYRKFFVSDSVKTQDFLNTIYSFGHVQYDHKNNIYNLEKKLTSSFVHVVSETMATSYYPFVTEKFLYSIVTRGLFLAYAQPGWHAHIEKYYGFKLYTTLFDYKFDSIQNPVERLIELITMILKFSKLTHDELYDLYLMELDSINYNYEHYFSGNYLDCLKQYNTSN